MRAAPLILILVVATSALLMSSGGICGEIHPERRLEVIRLDGNSLPMLLGVPVAHLRLVACSGESHCHVIPHQIDRRDRAGMWILAPQPSLEMDPAMFEPGDLLLFAARDSGVWSDAAIRSPEVLATVEISDPVFGGTRWVYVERQSVPRSMVPATLSVDPALDRMSGPHTDLGYCGGVPCFLRIDRGDNLLDRLKVRASARFLLGLFGFSRSEADLRTEVLGWKTGPLRIIRGQVQTVRIGWGIRSPAFVSYTYFYGDFAELPVTLRLNRPATFFLRDIRVSAVLDFRDLRGWNLVLPSRPGSIPIDGQMSESKRRLAEVEDHWFALVGPRATIVFYLGVSSSLASVRQNLLYREHPETGEIPEDLTGELPAVGYEITGWERVPAGVHSLQATAYVLPPSIDHRRFMAGQQHPLIVRVGEPSRGAAVSATPAPR